MWPDDQLDIRAPRDKTHQRRPGPLEGTGVQLFVAGGCHSAGQNEQPARDGRTSAHRRSFDAVEVERSEDRDRVGPLSEFLHEAGPGGITPGQETVGIEIEGGKIPEVSVRNGQRGDVEPTGRGYRGTVLCELAPCHDDAARPRLLKQARDAMDMR